MKRTLTVSELIELLEQFDENSPVLLRSGLEADAVFAAEKVSNSNCEVILLQSAGKFPDNDLTALLDMMDGEYAETVGVI